MKITTRGRYGLRIMIELASRYGSGPVGVTTIAKNRGISGKYIHVLMAALRYAGLAKATRGPGGGYELSRPPSEITALEIISALEGPIAPVECLPDEGACSISADCAAREVWNAVASAIIKVLSGITLDGLADRERQAREVALEYHI